MGKGVPIMSMRQAYVNNLNEILDSVRELIVALEGALDDTRKALFEGKIALAQKVRDGDDRFDDMIREIIRKDLTIQVLQSPVASDWRSLVAAFRVLSELERIADHCSDIALYTVRILERNPYVVPPAGFDGMFADMQSMLRESFRCYLQGDDEAAAHIGDKDDIVDADFERLLPVMTDLIQRDPVKVASYVDYILILKYMERTADHGVNIGNWVLYQKRNVLKGDNGVSMD